jgi:hypothetical protein
LALNVHYVSRLTYGRPFALLVENFALQEASLNTKFGRRMGPRNEQRLVVLRDIGVVCTVQMAGALSVSDGVTLSAGEVLVVDRRSDSTVFVRPHRYQTLETEFVEPALRLSAGYRGYYLELSVDAVTEDCKVLDQSA